MSNPRVMVCIPTGENGRRADFYDFINMLERPEGTMETRSHGQSPARNRNIMIRVALEHDATHCLFIDDDTAMKPDMLKKLLAHDKDIVGGLYLMRNFPHLPIMFDEAYDDGRCRFMALKPGMRGLIEVVNMGLGACLIKTDVFRKIPEPWITLGECEKDHWCDDISFFNRCRRAGYKMYVDLECPIGHNVNGYIWPNYSSENNKWYTMYNTGGTEAFQVDQRIPTEEEQEQAIKEAGVKKEQLHLVDK